MPTETATRPRTTMLPMKLKNQLVRLTPDRFDEVVDALGDAFRDYPVMRYVLKESGDRFDEHLPYLVGYFTYSRFSRNWPVLGVEREGRILAAANINPPSSVPAPAELVRRYEEMCRVLGDGAIRRFQAFADACDPLEPDEPHYYLGMIGVRPEAQGEGLARDEPAVLREVRLPDSRRGERRRVADVDAIPSRRRLSPCRRAGRRTHGSPRPGAFRSRPDCPAHGCRR